MIKFQSHIKAPTQRRKSSEPSKAECRAFDAYAAAYRKLYGCRLDRVAFNSETRNSIFKLPCGDKIGYNAQRCKELTKQFNFRRIEI